MAKLGVIGLGNMGRGMALSLQRGGFAVLGFDPSTAARDSVAAEGVETVDTIAALLAQVDTVILSLPNSAIVEAVVSGEGGVLASGKPGLLVIDTTTADPGSTRQVAASLTAAGMRFIDAPVSGGPKGAITATMTMVIGGDEADVARAMPMLEAMSAKRVHVGAVGAGHVTKLLNNLLCGANLVLAGEAARLAEAAGLDAEKIFEGINAGSGRSGVSLVNYPTWIFNGAFNSGFTMKLMRKDLRLAMQLLGQFDADAPLATETGRIWAASEGVLGDDEDFNRIVQFDATSATNVTQPTSL